MALDKTRYAELSQKNSGERRLDYFPFSLPVLP